jgi:hypothetical protein
MNSRADMIQSMNIGASAYGETGTRTRDATISVVLRSRPNPSICRMKALARRLSNLVRDTSFAGLSELFGPEKPASGPEGVSPAKSTKVIATERTGGPGHLDLASAIHRQASARQCFSQGASDGVVRAGS